MLAGGPNPSHKHRHFGIEAVGHARMQIRDERQAGDAAAPESYWRLVGNRGIIYDIGMIQGLFFIPY